MFVATEPNQTYFLNPNKHFNLTLTKPDTLHNFFLIIGRGFSLIYAVDMFYKCIFVFLSSLELKWIMMRVNQHRNRPNLLHLGAEHNQLLAAPAH